MRLNDLANKIRERDLILGELANEAVESAKSHRFMAALSCLFILTEQSVKYASDEVDGNLNNQISSLAEQGVLSANEASDFHNLRQIRNKIFHENNYMWVFADEQGKAALFSETETKEKIWNLFAEKILATCFRLQH